MLALVVSLLQAPCPLDESKVDLDHPQHYKSFATRCEGVYRRDLASSDRLTVVALIDQPLPAVTSPVLELHWGASTERPVHLQALSLRRSLPYRMDATVDTELPSFAWPTDVLRELGLRAGEIAVLAWTAPEKSETRVVLPVGAAASGESTTTDAFTLVCVPSVEIEEVFVTVLPAEWKDGWAQEADFPLAEWSDRALEHGYYPEWGPIQVKLPKKDFTPGLYRVTIAARYGANKLMHASEVLLLPGS